VRRVLLGITALVVLSGGIIFYISSNTANAAPGAQQKPQQQPTGQAAQKAPGAQGAGRVVSAVQATQGVIRLVFTYNGTIQPCMQVNLAPRSTGRLEQVLVDVGSEVKQGDPIAVLEKTSLQLAIQTAEANLKSAEARLATVTAGGRVEDVTSAHAALASAQARLNQLQSPSPADLQNAQTSLDKARSDLVAAQARLETAKQPYLQTDWAKAQSDVESYQSALKYAEAKLAQVKAGSTQADIQAQQAAVASAKSTLTSAEDKYETAKGVDSNGNSTLAASGFTSVSAALQNYNTAKANYDAALQKLNQMLAGPTASDLQSAQKDYDAALANYNNAMVKLDQMKQGPTIQDLQAYKTTVEKAEADLAYAEKRLAQLTSPTENDVAVLQATVTQATQAVAKARQPYTAQDVQTAQASVDVATVALTTAKTSLEDATLVAPFSGIITARNLSPGAVVSSSSPVVTLVSSDVEITVNIEESRLAQLKPGLATAIITPAYPEQSFQGKVVSIAPTADTRSHTFAMKVIPDHTGGKLKAGMYTEMKVTAEERAGVLIPRDAVIQRNGKDVVFVIVDGKAQMREVLQGLPQDGNIEIVTGIKSDEQVIVVGNSGLSDGDAVRTTGGQGGQQPDGQQQQRPQQGAPAKTGQ